MAAKVIVTVTTEDGEILERVSVEATEGPNKPKTPIDLAARVVGQLERSIYLAVNDA